MEEFKSYCLLQIKELDRIIERAEGFLKDAPVGRLRLAKSKNRVQYYWRMSPSDTVGKYIRKSNHILAKQLAQKDYAQKILHMAKKHRKALQEGRITEYPRDLMNLYDQLSAERRSLVDPYIISDDTYAARWEEKKQQEKEKLKMTDTSLLGEETGIFTEKGERVRSKSEKILADKLFAMGIPYVYECPLFQKGYGYTKPDFTLLNKRTRKEYYWEHLGMMGQTKYCTKAIKKIETYERNHIFPGKNLILTYETEEHALNTKIVVKLIQEYLV